MYVRNTKAGPWEPKVLLQHPWEICRGCAVTPGILYDSPPQKKRKEEEEKKQV